MYSAATHWCEMLPSYRCLKQKWTTILHHSSFLLCTDHSGKGYGSVREEAVKLFNCLQQLESAREPVPIIQGVLQTCLDLRPLRDEVYCQLVKQTSYTPAPYTAAHLRYWQLLTCMSCTFLPGPTVLKYLRFHLKRWDAHNSNVQQLTVALLKSLKGWLKSSTGQSLFIIISTVEYYTISWI